MATRKEKLIQGVRKHIQGWRDDAIADAIARVSDMDDALIALDEIDEETNVILPQPCNGPLYADCTFEDYIRKMHEELDEVEDAYKHFNPTKGESIDHLFLECTDLITVVVSAMESFGCDEGSRQAYQGIVNGLNARRDGGQRIRRDVE